jgi:hypothetical protein
MRTGKAGKVPGRFYRVSCLLPPFTAYAPPSLAGTADEQGWPEGAAAPDQVKTFKVPFFTSYSKKYYNKA